MVKDTFIESIETLDRAPMFRQNMEMFRDIVSSLKGTVEGTEISDGYWRADIKRRGDEWRAYINGTKEESLNGCFRMFCCALTQRQQEKVLKVTEIQYSSGPPC